MKIKSILEISFLGILYLALAAYHVYMGITFSKTIHWVQIHTITTGLIVGTIFFGNVFYLYPTIYSSSRKKYWIFSGFVLLVLFLVESLMHAYKASALIKDQRGLNFDPYNMLFQPFNLEESIPVVFGTFLISFVYVTYRQRIKNKNRAVLRT